MRRYYLMVGLLIGGLLAGAARAETFNLTDGNTVSGELLITSANDGGVKIKVGDGDYKTVPWASFSQEDLKKFVANKKMEPFVEPFIEISQAEKLKRTEVNIKQPPRLERPERRSLLGAMASSGLGLLMLLVLYAANIYAGYEISVFRSQSPAWSAACPPSCRSLAPLSSCPCPRSCSRSRKPGKLRQSPRSRNPGRRPSIRCKGKV